MLALVRDLFGRIFSIRLFRFSLVGGISSGIYALVVWLLLHFALMGSFAASVMGYCVAIPFNFLGQKRYTFRSTANAHRELATFIAVHVFNVFLSGVVLHTTVEILMLPTIVAIFLVIGLMAVSSYLLLKLLVFVKA